MRLSLVLAVFAILSTGCVHSYQAVDYQSPDFVQTDSDDGLEFSYLYDAQTGYYGSKAAKRGYSVVAVRVVNMTDQPAVFDRNTLKVQFGGQPVVPVRAETVASAVRQPVWNKLLWALLNISILDGDGDVVAFIPSGPVIAGATILVSSGNNRKVRRDYERDSLFGLVVPARGAAEGLLFLSGTGRAPITFDYTAGGG